MSDDLKDRILETAESLFDARGVRDVTIDDVCRQLSISKKTFYQFYAQKEDLVGAVVQKRIADNQQYFSRIFRGKNAVEIFWILYDRALRKKTHSPESRMSADIRKYYPETFQRTARLRSAETTQIVRGFLRQGVEEGYFRDDLDLDAAMLLTSFLHKGVIRYCAGEEITGGRRISYKRICETATDMVVRTLMTDRGREEFARCKNENKDRKQL